MTIEVEDDPKQEQQDADTNNQSVLDIHKASVKQQVDTAITELFFVVLVRSLASLAWFLSAFVFAEKSYEVALLYPLIISEGSVVIFTLVFSKPKSKSFLPSLIDATKIIESGIIITCCLETQRSTFYFAGYLSLALISWKLLFCGFLKSINETFAIRIVVSSHQGPLFYRFGREDSDRLHHGQTILWQERARHGDRALSVHHRSRDICGLHRLLALPPALQARAGLSQEVPA